VVQDLKVQGQAAQMSRGMMQDVSAKLTKQFADCLEANLQAEEREEAAPPAAAAASVETVAADDTAATPEPVAAAEGAVRNAPPAGAAPEGPSTPATSRRPVVAAKPLGGIGLLLGALWNAAVRFIKRLRGGRSKPTP
jgi:uncharacterized protein